MKSEVDLCTEDKVSKVSDMFKPSSFFFFFFEDVKQIYEISIFHYNSNVLSVLLKYLKPQPTLKYMASYFAFSQNKKIVC